MTETLAAALVAAQAAMPSVPKDATNPHFNSKFVSLDGLIEKTRPVLNEHGLAIVQFPTVTELGQLVLKTILIHGASGEKLQADTPLLGHPETSQQYGSAVTYARRYAWASVLGIASEQDDDGNSAEPTKPNRKAKAPVEPKTITEKQRGRLFAIGKANGIDDARIRELVAGVTGRPSTEGMSIVHYEQVIRKLEAEAGKPVEDDAARQTRLMRRLTVLTDKAETEAGMLLPQGQDSWDGYARNLAQIQFGVTLDELKVDELAALVDEIQEQMVPF